MLFRSDAAGDPRSDRTLWPFTTTAEGDGTPASLAFRGRPADPSRRFRVAFNTYDAQSGGRRLPRLAALVARPEAKRTRVPLDTRAALIESLLERGTIG